VSMSRGILLKLGLRMMTEKDFARTRDGNFSGLTYANMHSVAILFMELSRGDKPTYRGFPCVSLKSKEVYSVRPAYQ